jgi:arylesterase/paraoxonase
MIVDRKLKMTKAIAIVMTAIVGALAAVVYQLQLPQTVRLGLGLGKTIQPLSDFPGYRCRRLEDRRLQSCEDMWLSDSARQLFLACYDLESRVQWNPRSVHRSSRLYPGFP